jgi:hypothetical protein
MKETEREVSIVGEQQRPRGAEVEPPHRNDARPGAVQVLGDGGTPRRVPHRAHDVPRLVEHQVNVGFANHGSAVDRDAASVRIRSGAELRDDTTIHGHAPGGDELFRLPARRDPTAG